MLSAAFRFRRRDPLTKRDVLEETDAVLYDAHGLFKQGQLEQAIAACRADAQRMALTLYRAIEAKEGSTASV